MTRYLEKLEEEQDINEEAQTAMEKEFHIPITLNLLVCYAVESLLQNCERAFELGFILSASLKKKFFNLF